MNGFKHGDHLLTVEGVSLTLDGHVILRDVNAQILDVQRTDSAQVTGQIVGFLGRSGMGKTQMSLIMAGLQKPTTGRVLLNSNGTPVQAGLVGYVTQDYLLFEHRTVLGNLLVAGKQAGLSQAQAKDKAFVLLNRFGLADRAKYYPIQLSGGQRQRVAVCQQLMCSEHFLIMDEPFSGLDGVNQAEMMKLIVEVANADELNTIILITHDVTAACTISDTLWLMHRDRDEQGREIPGARIQHSYDLAEMGFAWRHDLAEDPTFRQFVYEVKQYLLKT